MKNKTINLRVTDKQYDSLEKIAKKRNQTLSELIRIIFWLFTDGVKK